MARRITKLPALPQRRKDSHKGDYGRAFIIAGSTGMTGAACLAGEAALRGGAGLVTVGTPAGVHPILEVKMTSVMTKPLSETPGGTLSLDALPEIVDFIKNVDVLAIGPGIGRNEETADLVEHLIKKSNCRLIIDADGLNNLSDRVDVLKHARGRAIISPHPGEMSRLIKKPTSFVQKNRSRASADFASRYGLTVILKGYKTVVTDGDRTYVNTTGNPGMATAGSGDVLTGLLTGLVAQGMENLSAGSLAVYIHGLAGDLAARKVGQISLMAEDILDYLPEAFSRYEKGSAARGRGSGKGKK